MAGFVAWFLLAGAVPAFAQITQAQVDECTHAAGRTPDNAMTPECFELVQQFDREQAERDRILAQATPPTPAPTPTPGTPTPPPAAPTPTAPQSPSPAGGIVPANPQVTPPAGGVPLGGGSVVLRNPLSGISTIPQLLVAILRVVITIAIPIIILFFMLAGFKYVTARGNPEKIKEASQALLYAVIGAVLILGATAITHILSNLVNAFRT